MFTGRKWRNAVGAQGISWDLAGVWQADSEEEACLVAAQETGAGTCFAVEGFAWGVDTVDAPRARKLGVPQDAITRLERMGQDLAERIALALPTPQQRELHAGDDDGE